MKSLCQYIVEATESNDQEQDNEIRAKIKFKIWESPDKFVTKLTSNTGYQSIECTYQEGDDTEGIKVMFLLGFKDGEWRLWAGKPGVVSYADDPFQDLGTSDFHNAIQKGVDACVELVNKIKDEPNNWVQFYVDA